MENIGSHECEVTQRLKVLTSAVNDVHDELVKAIDDHMRQADDNDDKKFPRQQTVVAATQVYDHCCRYDFSQGEK